MRFRLFTFLFLILFVVAVCSALLDNYFVNREKIAFIDQELNDVAAVLLKSDLSLHHEKEIAGAEAIISKELGGNRLGKFFAIRDAAGNNVFQTIGVKLLPVSELPIAPKWITLRKSGKFIRILNIPLGTHDETLQAGFVADEGLILNPILAARDLYEVLGLTLIGLLVSWSLARKLLNPLRKLAAEVSSRAALSASASVLPEIPLSSTLSLPLGERRDEFHQLVAGLNALISRVNRGYEVSRIWSYQMAHELKTPMAILTAEIEGAEEAENVSSEVAERVKREVVSVSDTVSAFLLWAEIVGASVRKDLHVVRLRDVVQDLASRRQTQLKGRLDFRIETEERVAVSLAYLEIVLNNLLSNAIAYSEPGTPVVVSANGFKIEIRNFGPEIPADVLSKIGEPFNRGPGSGKRGHGLGLATVFAITKVFDWKLEFSYENGETRIALDVASAALEDEA